MGHAIKKIASFALPIAGAAFGGPIGGALGGAAGGALSGGGLKGILSGAALGGAGGYFSDGGSLGGLLGESSSSATLPGIGKLSLGDGTGIKGLLSGVSPIGGASATSGLSSYGSIGSNILSGVIGTDANDEAKKALLKSQEQNTALLQPFLNEKFDPSQLASDPGYQFIKDQGNQALNAKQAASGNYFSGGALKDADTYNTGVASQQYNNAYNQFLQTQQQKLGAAQGLTNINDTAANATAGAGINNSNILSQSLSGILGGKAYSNTGASLGGNDELLKLLMANRVGSGAQFSGLGF